MRSKINSFICYYIRTSLEHFSYIMLLVRKIVFFIVYKPPQPLLASLLLWALLHIVIANYKFRKWTIRHLIIILYSNILFLEFSTNLDPPSFSRIVTPILIFTKSKTQNVMMMRFHRDIWNMSDSNMMPLLMMMMMMIMMTMIMTNGEEKLMIKRNLISNYSI